MTAFASMFPEKGFTCIETDLTMPDNAVTDSAALMHHFESRSRLSYCCSVVWLTLPSSELASDIRLAAIPFPPVIFARGSASLVAQTYISSNPASGLFLISPPVSNAEPDVKASLPTPLKEFDFEPKFPIAIMAKPKEMQAIKAKSRLGQDPGVDRIEVDDVEGQKAFVAIDQWLDELGV